MKNDLLKGDLSGKLQQISRARAHKLENEIIISDAINDIQICGQQLLMQFLVFIIEFGMKGNLVTVESTLERFIQHSGICALKQLNGLVWNLTWK